MKRFTMKTERFESDGQASACSLCPTLTQPLNRCKTAAERRLHESQISELQEVLFGTAKAALPSVKRQALKGSKSTFQNIGKTTPKRWKPAAETCPVA